MEDYKLIGDEILCPIEQYISLLEYKLICLQTAKDNDSSWNYRIDDLKETIKKLKQEL